MYRINLPKEPVDGFQVNIYCMQYVNWEPMVWHRRYTFDEEHGEWSACHGRFGGPLRGSMRLKGWRGVKKEELWMERAFGTPQEAAEALLKLAGDRASDLRGRLAQLDKGLSAAEALLEELKG